MRYQAVIDHYERQQAIAEALGISVQAVSQWQRRGIVPYHSATRIHELTAGAVDLEPDHYGPGGHIVAEETSAPAA